MRFERDVKTEHLRQFLCVSQKVSCSRLVSTELYQINSWGKILGARCNACWPSERVLVLGGPGLAVLCGQVALT